MIFHGDDVTRRRATAVLVAMLSLSACAVVNGTTSSCPIDDCQPPDCFCPGLTPPGDLPIGQIPQMVMLTFDDAVLTEFDVDVYQRIFSGAGSHSGSGSGRRRTNPNGCPIVATFYASHNGTDYDLVGRLHRAGHEMASHSVTHRLPQSFWTTATYDQWRREIAGQSDNLVKLGRLENAANDDATTVTLTSSAGRRRSKRRQRLVVGARAPFLETGGNAQLEMMADEGFLYDSSMMVGPHSAGAVWPFTLDYPPSVEFCSNNRCPKRPIPGLWELPLNRWVGRDGRPCAMVDSCDVQPISKGDALSYFWHNFGRFYRGNRAPFGIHLHPDWLLGNADYFAAFETFIDSLLTDMQDVYFVTATQAIAWMKDPQTVDQAPFFAPWMASCRRPEKSSGEPRRVQSDVDGAGQRQETNSQDAAGAPGNRNIKEKSDYFDENRIAEQVDGELAVQRHQEPQLNSSASAATEDIRSPELHRAGRKVTSPSSSTSKASTVESNQERFTNAAPDSDEQTPMIASDSISTADSSSSSSSSNNNNSLTSFQIDAEHDDGAGGEIKREPLSASNRRRNLVALNGFVDKTVSVYEEPIGQLAEPKTSKDTMEDSAKTSDETGNVDVAQFVPGDYIKFAGSTTETERAQRVGEHLDVDHTSRTTTRESAPRPTPQMLQINDRTATPDAHEFRRVGLDVSNGYLRRAVDVGQLKSGKQDEAEELIHSTSTAAAQLNDVEHGVLVPSSATGPAVLVQKAVVNAGNLFKPTQSAAVMSDTAQVKSSSPANSRSRMGTEVAFILAVTTLILSFN